MPVRYFPDINSITDISSQYRDHLVAVLKCDGAGWVELITNTRAETASGTPAYQVSTLGGYEQVINSNTMMRIALSSLPRVTYVQPWTVFTAISSASTSQTSSAVVAFCSATSKRGAAVKAEQFNNTGDVGLSKLNVIDIRYTGLNTTGIESGVGLAMKSDYSSYAVTDTGTATSTNTTAMSVSPVPDYFTIGAAYGNAGAPGDWYRGNVGPYILIFNDSIPVERVIALAYNPSLLARNRLSEIIQITSAATAAGSYTLTADAGSYTLTGTAATLTVQRKLSAGAGSYTITGTDAAFLRGYALAAGSGSYTLTGANAALTAQRKLAAAAGSYTITGTDATLTYSTGSTYTMTAEAGSYTLTGTAAALTAQRKLSAAAGSYTINGTDASLVHGYTLTAAAGSYAITGTAATFRATRALIASAGSYTITGTAATLRYSTADGWTLQADTAAAWSVQSDSNTSWSIQ